MRYFISDLHFYHESLLIRMDCRGFENCEKMHEYMIEKWNQKVRPQDEVVILGDVSMERGKKTSEILERLNGRLYLVVGNHDNYLEDRRFDRDRFEWIKDYAVLHENKKKIVLSHYPIMCYDGQYRRDKEGMPKTYMLYGHVHNTRDEVLINHYIREARNTIYEGPGSRIKKNSAGENETFQPSDNVQETKESLMIPCQMINCFCMFSDYTPLSLEEWAEVDEKRRQNMWEAEDGRNENNRSGHEMRGEGEKDETK